jgi:hypothetical protein
LVGFCIEVSYQKDPSMIKDLELSAPLHVLHGGEGAENGVSNPSCLHDESTNSPKV